MIESRKTDQNLNAETISGTFSRIAQATSRAFRQPTFAFATV